LLDIAKEERILLNYLGKHLLGRWRGKCVDNIKMDYRKNVRTGD
jgi:hypothetical protein